MLLWAFVGIFTLASMFCAIAALNKKFKEEEPHENDPGMDRVRFNHTPDADEAREIAAAGGRRSKEE